MRSYVSMLCVLSCILLIDCSQSTQEDHQGEAYAEKHRPQFHFSPKSGWMNDPNGLVFYEGEYHLFYQHYPDSTVWGPMHWGHAVSKDLVYWEHLPIALYPDSMGYIFSGSAVLDKDNTSGFGENGKPPLVAIFTHHDMQGEKAGRNDIETQSIAYSNDKGRTWIKYADNPVVANPGIRNFRDPKVFWHDSTAHWIMPIAAGDHLDFYRSPDLKQWDKTGEFGKDHGGHGGTWECPDLFPLTTNDGVQKWILLQNMDRGAVNGGSGTQYFVGHFDGKTFINDNSPESTLWFDYGADNYAGVTWFNAPGNRRIFIGWMSQWFDYAQKVPTHPWRSAMTLPRELSLKSTPEGLRLFQLPVNELNVLRKNPTSFSDTSLVDSLTVSDGNALLEFEMEVDFSGSDTGEMGFMLKNKRGERLIAGYNRVDSTFFIDRRHAGQASFSDKFAGIHTAPYHTGRIMKVRALIDVASVEIFLDDGRIAMTEIFFPNEDFTTLQLYCLGGPVKVKHVDIYPLKTIW